MPKLIALKPFSYNSVRYAKGDTVITKDKHARALIATKIAKEAPPEPSQTAHSGRFYATREMEAARPLLRETAPAARVDWNSYTVPELKQQADKRGIEYPSRVTKGALIKLLKG